MQASFGEFFEDVNDALREAIRALGGYKKVGPKLFPDVLEDQAANRLRDCLNPDRRDTLTPSRVLMILRMAREAGFHGAMSFIAFDAGYEPPRPVVPEDQENELQRAFVDAVSTLETIQKQLQKVQGLRAVGGTR